MSFPAPPLLQVDQILANMPTMGNVMNLDIALTARIRRTAQPRLVPHSMVVAKIYLLLIVGSVVLMNNPVAKLFRAAHGRRVLFTGVLARDGPHTMPPHAAVESVTTMSQQRIRQYLSQSPHIAKHY